MLLFYMQYHSRRVFSVAHCRERDRDRESTMMPDRQTVTQRFPDPAIFAHSQRTCISKTGHKEHRINAQHMTIYTQLLFSLNTYSNFDYMFIQYIQIDMTHRTLWIMVFLPVICLMFGREE